MKIKFYVNLTESHYRNTDIDGFFFSNYANKHNQHMIYYNKILKTDLNENCVNVIMHLYLPSLHLIFLFFSFVNKFISIFFFLFI